MTDPNADRRAELAALVLSGATLSPAEEAELAALDAAHPDAARERAELAALVERLGAVDAWDEAVPRDALAARVAAVADDEERVPTDARVATASTTADRADVRSGRDGPATEPPPVALTSVRRRRVALPLAIAAAAASLAIGAVAGALTAGSLAGEDAVATADGPPGTLGALEPVEFHGQPDTIEIEGALVAHTWGTETVLAIDGLPTGSTFEVVVVGEDGTEHSSGTMLGTDVTIDCRLNAAVLREDVATVEIRAESGEELAHADVVRL